MPPKLRIAYLAHSLRSDWNNGNAHFLRGLMRSMTVLGHDMTILEPENEWSIENLQMERLGERSLADFNRIYPELKIQTYGVSETVERWRERLNGVEIVILHEWNPPALAKRLLHLRGQMGFQLLFHDTHHRASSSPEQMRQFDLVRFDGVFVFGEALRKIYRERFGVARVWVLHEAADTTVFHPRAHVEKSTDVVWIGNWGEGERSAEIQEFFLRPAAALASATQYKNFMIYGVRYPPEGLQALKEAHVKYGGYLPNLDAPSVYASAKLTVHVPRQQYNSAMAGIPTIRVFEALASGIPLVSAPWLDTESLFRPNDFRFAHNASEMTAAVQTLLNDSAAAAAQAQRGLETVIERHTCDHRARELTHICEELLS